MTVGSLFSFLSCLFTFFFCFESLVLPFLQSYINWAVLSRGTVYCTVLGNSNFKSVDKTLVCYHSNSTTGKEKFLSQLVLLLQLLCVTRRFSLLPSECKLLSRDWQLLVFVILYKRAVPSSFVNGKSVWPAKAFCHGQQVHVVLHLWFTMLPFL